MVKPSSLSNNILHLCGEFSHRFAVALGRNFEENNVPVTPEQFAVLVVLLYRDGITQKEISETLGRDKTTVARVVSNMKKNGLVKQVTDAGDGRARLVYLTKKGRTVQEKALNISGVMYMRALKGVDEKMLQAGIQVLQQMLTNF